MGDDPGKVLPLEIFIRQYYTPRLFSRLCGSEKLAPLPNLSEINRAQPLVAITAAESDPNHPGRALVRVKVTRRTIPFGSRTQASGSHDLRVFRDGRLVAFLRGDLEDKEYVFDNIQLPRWPEKGSVELRPKSIEHGPGQE
jgi:hypothetical protein